MEVHKNGVGIATRTSQSIRHCRHSERSEESKGRSFTMPHDRKAWVYILASRKNGTLYVGVTTDIHARIWQHKTGVLEGFTKEHHVTTLVYHEYFQSIRDAITREKVLKGWNRQRKIALIEVANPDWDDLAADWFGGGLDPSHGSG
jgi:putative endonuclease